MKKFNLYKCLVAVSLFQLLNIVVFAQEKITFSPHWLPQAQFAGYYVALDQEFYKDAGLNVKIIHPTADVSSFEFLTSGEADVISSFLIDAIKQKLNRVPLVNIAQLSQHSALMMVTKKKSGINEIKDFQNKKLAIWSNGFDDVPLAFFRENNYNIELVRILNTINLFLMDGVDALTAMYYNEYDQIINSGINENELNTFFFSDYGLNIPEDGLYCMKNTREEKADALQKFVTATLKGWEYAANNRDYTVTLVVEEMNKSHLPNNMAHQRWMLDKVIELMSAGNKNVLTGQLLEQDFYRALNLLEESNNQEYSGQNLKFENFYKPVNGN